MAAGTTSTSSSSSSSSDSDSGSDISADDVTQDSRDVLVQRLNDLAQRLSAADVRASDVGALHAQVDDMERVLSRGSRARSASRHSSSGTSELHKARPVLLLPTHLHPSSVEQPEPVAAAADATSGNDSPKISSEMADRIVEEAEGLCAEMASVIESLQKRREESDHLHAVLIQREGAADKLILEQAGRIGELEDTVAEDESELRYLKIQLRGIEAQCMGYIPKGADPELDLSIRNWKKDWTSLRDRWATRRATSFASGDESSTFSNSASPSAG
ncbi:hypothetical protein VP1G_05036 [Cytospora mali]|uniref:Uncharacterized protein n=1 Tax=Cytospora mali TaxID=578113 RepID=A0A194V1D3_CYTMA|nr:hypothetical protein VP1G_05036 [Valsa mali var. pyri (nom. inval.)]